MASAHRRGAALTLGLLLAFAGVATGRLLAESTGPTPSPTASMLLGNDVDENGCRASAGEEWCIATSSCIRPWETECHTTTPPASASSPVVPPLTIAAADNETRAPTPAAAFVSGDSVCTGQAGLMGGWTQQQDDAADAGMQAAAKFVLASLGLADHAFQVTTACTQAVAGVILNYYLEVTVSGVGSGTAVIYQPPRNGAEMQIMQLHYKPQ